MVAAPQVQLREDGRTPHLVENVLDAGKGVSIQRRLLIKGPVVPTPAEVCVIPQLILPLYHHRGRGGERLGGTFDEAQAFKSGALRLHKL